MSADHERIGEDSEKRPSGYAYQNVHAAVATSVQVHGSVNPLTELSRMPGRSRRPVCSPSEAPVRIHRRMLEPYPSDNAMCMGVHRTRCYLEGPRLKGTQSPSLLKRMGMKVP